MIGLCAILVSMTDDPLFTIGEKVLVDNKVPGRVDGFYVNAESETLVVFKPDWKWDKHVWGEARGNGLEGEEIKLVAYSLILVHPDNLSRSE